MMTFSTDNLQRVFAEEGKYDAFRKLCSDLVKRNDIFELDENGVERRVSKSDANKAIKNVFMDICGLTEDKLKSKMARKKAIKKHAPEIFEVIEEDIEFRVQEGFMESEWFNQFVDMRNVALGDANEFTAIDDVNLIVSEFSGHHHDTTLQQLGEGETFMVKTINHVVKIGKDIDLVLLGRVDYTKLIDKIAEAYIRDIQDKTYAAVYGASAKLPQTDLWIGTGALGTATKDKFDGIIEAVGAANNANVIIMGTKTALKKITALADVDWASSTQKEEIANSGRLGSYEATTLIEVPQRFKIGGAELAADQYLVDNKTLLILPATDDKFVKFVDEGDTEIFEVTNKADNMDDFNTHEVVRSYGSEVVLGQYFGKWTLA